ncbi:MAG: 2-hydroxyacyl-CoA dehydratase, partial [Firmicutes bacterium]|nr:2-hydroxyacyl-CoA dehydratase [Bacillota bacterium]
YIEPENSLFEQAESLMHPIVCSFVKCALEDIISAGYDGVVLTSCCDSTRRLYDVIKNRYPEKFIYLLELPVKKNPAARKVFENSLWKMIREYEAFSGKEFREESLLSAMEKANLESTRDAGNLPGAVNVGLLGARYSPSVMDLIRRSGANISFNISCTGQDHHFCLAGDGSVMEKYVEGLFSKVPCMRMEDGGERNRYWEEHKEGLSGLIFHTVKFCDNYSYEYAGTRDELDLPVLKIETDYTPQAEGQLKTRVDAFIEAVDGQPLPPSGTDPLAQSGLNRAGGTIGDNAMGKYVLGIDSGSTSTNAVILDENKKVVAWTVVRTGARSGQSAEKALAEVLEKAGLVREDLCQIVATGYGRVSIPFADKVVTEISCHGKGAHYINPKVRTILDIGGQDSKAIRLDEQGNVKDFAMNDKCAAGTGRFLEMMARTLELSIDQMGPESMNWKEDLKISSMCTVFAESEVISLIAENKDKADIIRALNQAIASRNEGLLARVGVEPVVMMTGGVAKNVGVVKAVEEKLGQKLFIYEEPEIIGALGAALFAFE